MNARSLRLSTAVLPPVALIAAALLLAGSAAFAGGPGPITFEAKLSAPQAIPGDSIDLAWKLSVAKDAALGPRKLSAKVSYQACNDETCEMPKEVTVPLAFDV